MSRVLVLLVVPACLLAVQPAWAGQPDFQARDFRLQELIAHSSGFNECRAIF